MLNYLSNRIADFLLLNRVISTEEKDVYIYGLKLAISSALNFVICLLISIAMNQLLNGIMFFVAFSSLRKFTGGFHSKKYLNCNIIFGLTVFISLLLNQTIDYYFNEITVIVSLILCAIVIFMFAPVYNANKELSEDETIKFKILSLVVYCIHIFIYAIIFFAFGYKFNIIIITDVVVTLMILIGILNNILHKNLSQI